jgi:hypothetical protein
MAMPHARSSCRDKSVTFWKTELERLYAGRLALESTIRELESWKRAIASAGDSRAATSSLEFSSKPCNLTSCRSA